MDIDLSILRMLEREKEISFDILVEAIEQALLTAYHKTAGAQTQARVELNRKSGHVTVWASELDEEGNAVGEYDDTPEGFGRIAATTAKQIMLQRLRDAEDEVRFGEFSGKEGDIISGVIQPLLTAEGVAMQRFSATRTLMLPSPATSKPRS